MAIVETTQELPPTLTADGTIKISGTRVSLDSVVLNYRQGATAETRRPAPYRRWF